MTYGTRETGVRGHGVRSGGLPWVAAAAAVALLAVGGLAFGQSAPASPPPPGAGPDFNGAIRPILVSRCTGCHGAQLQRGGLRLDQRDAAFRGGAHGPVLIPGDSAASKLFQMVESRKMPLDNELSVLELNQLKAWINAGAKWPETQATAARTADPRVDDFRLALRNQDGPAITRALADPTLVNAHGRDGATPLHHAVTYGTPDQVRRLLDGGASVKATNPQGVTPLMWAVRDETVTKLLIDRGADVNAVSDGGVTPLGAAAGSANGAKVVRLLLDRGARVAPGQQPALGNTLGSGGDLATLKLFFPRVLDPNGPAAANAAANGLSGRCLACLDFLIGQGARGNTLNGALVVAANGGDVALVRRLLDLGATLDGRASQDETALIAAVTSDIGSVEKVRMLLAAGANPNVPDAHGRTPLTFARTHRPEVVADLLAKGAK